MSSFESGSYSGVETIKLAYPSIAGTLDKLTALCEQENTPEDQKKLINAFLEKKAGEIMDSGALVNSAAFETEAKSLIETTNTAIKELKKEIVKGRKKMDISVESGSPL